MRQSITEFSIVNSDKSKLITRNNSKQSLLKTGDVDEFKQKIMGALNKTNEMFTKAKVPMSPNPQGLVAPGDLADKLEQEIDEITRNNSLHSFLKIEGQTRQIEMP